MKKIFTVILACVVLTSCSTAKEINTNKIEVSRQPLDLVDPKPLDLDEFEFLTAKTDNGVLSCLTGDGYKALSLNTRKLRNYIQQQQDIIKAYREYYESE